MLEPFVTTVGGMQTSDDHEVLNRSSRIIRAPADDLRLNYLEFLEVYRLNVFAIDDLARGRWASGAYGQLLHVMGL
jgi:hypothetical protein